MDILSNSFSLQPSKQPAPAARPTPFTATVRRPLRRTKSRARGARAAPVRRGSAPATALLRRTPTSPSPLRALVLAVLGLLVRSPAFAHLARHSGTVMLTILHQQSPAHAKRPATRTGTPSSTRTRSTSPPRSRSTTYGTAFGESADRLF